MGLVRCSLKSECETHWVLECRSGEALVPLRCRDFPSAFEPGMPQTSATRLQLVRVALWVMTERLNQDVNFLKQQQLQVQQQQLQLLCQTLQLGQLDTLKVLS